MITVDIRGIDRIPADQCKLPSVGTVVKLVTDHGEHLLVTQDSYDLCTGCAFFNETEGSLSNTIQKNCGDLGLFCFNRIYRRIDSLLEDL